MFTLTIGATSVEVKLGYDLGVDVIHFKQLRTSKLVPLKLGGLHYSVPLLVNGGSNLKILLTRFSKICKTKHENPHL